VPTAMKPFDRNGEGVKTVVVKSFNSRDPLNKHRGMGAAWLLVRGDVQQAVDMNPTEAALKTVVKVWVDEWHAKFTSEDMSSGENDQPVETEMVVGWM
jgi:hypothetical protein